VLVAKLEGQRRIWWFRPDYVSRVIDASPGGGAESDSGKRSQNRHVE